MFKSSKDSYTILMQFQLAQFILPKIDETPATCKDKIAYSVDPLECALIPLKGGWIKK